ncbi:CorA family divalent cation transporter [Haloferula sargassicola]|uniref:CorA-like Mg2+ transporter protein n=1 Tax=Haloferula sargassicola TaxID=490096 RepID=A0ABP9UVC0_9BACT
MVLGPHSEGLPQWLDLEPEILSQISCRPGGQRCLSGGGELLLVVHEVPEPKVPERAARFFIRREEGEWDDGEGHGLEALGRLLDRYQETIDRYEASIDELDTAAEVFAMIRHAGPIARTLRNLTVALRSAVDLAREDRQLIELRDRASDILRAAEILYHDAKLTLDFWQAESAEEHQEAAERLNVIAYRLNLLAGFFLPLVAMGGLLGMNVNIPDVFRNLFWGILAMGMLAGVGLLIFAGWNLNKKS